MHEPQHIDAIIQDLLEDTSVENRGYPVVTQLVVAGMLILVMFGITYVVPKSQVAHTSTPAAPNPSPSETSQSATVITATTPPFPTLELRAQKVYVYNVHTQEVVFAKDSEIPHPLASLTKLMTALLAYETLPPNLEIPFSSAAINIEGDFGFSEGEIFTTAELIDSTLINSANDAAYLLGLEVGKRVAPEDDPMSVFVSLMNIRAEEIGLKNTIFFNSTGLDLSPTEAGALGTAEDMGILMAYMLQHAPDVLAYTNRTNAAIVSKAGTRHILENTNYITHEIPGLRASKTGYTVLAGGNLATVFDVGLGKPYIIVVLGSTHAGRFDDTKRIVRAIMSSTPQ